MTNEKIFNYVDGFKILLAVMTFGFGWFADNQATMIAYAAVLIVWILGEAAKRIPSLNWIKGKGPLTVAIFVVSFILAYLFQPFVLPTLPGWTGDAGSYVPLLSVWLQAFFAIVGAAVTFAMSIYNMLLAQILEKLPEFFGLRLN